MQLLMMSSSSSSSSSSQSAGGRPDHIQGMEEFQHLHLRSSPPPDAGVGDGVLDEQHPRPPPSPHRKAMKKLHHHPHGHHSSPPHHHGRFAHKLHHDSFAPPPPVCADLIHCKKDKLRVKHLKHCKKVGKLHRKLMKACKAPKGTAHHLHMHNHVCPFARSQLASPFIPAADAPHHPGCCLHNRRLSMMQDAMLTELEQHPPCHHEAGVGRHRHPHRHGKHGPHVGLEIRRGSVPPMSPARHEAQDMQAEPALEAGVPHAPSI